MSIEDLELKLSFLERHFEKTDRAFLELSDQVRALEKKVEKLTEQQSKGHSHGGGESLEDAVPPHYSSPD